MNPTAIYSKTGKGVQEASGRTNHLSRADRAVLSAIDGKSTLAELSQKFEKIGEAKLLQLIEKMDKDGFVREVSPGAPAAIRPRPVAGGGRTGSRPAIPPPASPPKQEAEEDGGELDFTSFIPTAPRAASTTPKAKPSPGSTTSQRVDLAAQAHAEAQRKTQEQSFDFKAREQAEAKAKQEAAARAKEEAAARARAEAEAKGRAEAAAKEKAEADARAKAAAEARAKADADAKAKVEAEAKARSDSEAKSKALRDAAIRAASEARQKAEAEAKAKAEAEERANKEAEERARIEQEMNAKLDAERKAREHAERNAQEQAERLAKEAEERARREVEEKARQESDELRQQLETERKAREEAERKAREEEERRRKEVDEAKRKEEEERRRREAEEAKRKAGEEARRKEQEERKRKDAEEARRKAEEEARRETEEAIQRQTAEAGKRRAAEEANRRADDAAKAAPAASALSDDLLADLDSFAKRDEEEQKAREAEERRVKEDAERKAKEAEARKRKEEESQRLRDAEARRREEAQARARAEAEARAEREREEQEREAAERRKRQIEEAAGLSARSEDEDDIDISEDDLDLDEIRQEERVLSKSARKAEAKQALEDAAAVPAAPAEKKKESKVLSFFQKIKQTREMRAKAPKPAKAPKAAKAKPIAPKEVQAKRIRRRKFGKPLGLAALVLLAVGVGAVHVMPMPTGDYESAASASLGIPVKIASAGMSLVTGVQVKLEGITIGSGAEAIRIVRARAYPSLSALISSQMAFSRIELEGARVPQTALARGLLGGLKGGALQTDSIVFQGARFEGALPLPALDVTLKISPQGLITRASLRGPDGIEATLTPKGKEIAVDAKADALSLPFLKGVTLTDVALKGSATRESLTLSAWDARLFDGVISGNAELRWGAQWSLRGDVVSKGVNAAVFAPALLSEGKADGKGRFGMSGSDPKALGQNAQLEGAFTINKGVLGSFDLSRAIQTKGKQSSGRTLFSELSGEGVYQGGAVSLRSLNMGAGKLNAAGTIDIAANGELKGRVVADVESGPRAINEPFSLVGTLKEPRLVAPAK